MNRGPLKLSNIRGMRLVASIFLHLFTNQKVSKLGFPPSLRASAPSTATSATSLRPAVKVQLQWLDGRVRDSTSYVDYPVIQRAELDVASFFTVRNLQSCCSSK